jgi:hypothetical protein
MALDQSALLEVLDALKVADVGDRGLPRLWLTRVGCVGQAA